MEPLGTIAQGDSIFKSTCEEMGAGSAEKSSIMSVWYLYLIGCSLQLLHSVCVCAYACVACTIHGLALTVWCPEVWWGHIPMILIGSWLTHEPTSQYFGIMHALEGAVRDPRKGSRTPKEARIWIARSVNKVRVESSSLAETRRCSEAELYDSDFQFSAYLNVWIF